MPTKQQDSWVFNVLGADVDAIAAAVKTTVQSLPGSPMLADCKPVKGKVKGPPEHLLCTTHGHIVDVTLKKIVAVSLQQYEQQNIGAAKPAAPVHANPVQATPTQATPAAADTHMPPAAANPTASPADADAAKMRAQVKHLLSQMQIEMGNITSIQEEYEDLAGGSRLNRAISWISDKAGGADDPGDDLKDIASQMTQEHISGMTSVGTFHLDVAEQHLATMKALSHKAYGLWQKYRSDTGDGAGNMVTGLTVVSKAGDVATMGLSVLAPGTGKILSVVKDVSVVGSKMAFGEKVNWAEFTIDMAFDLFVGGEGSQGAKVVEKIAGPLTKKLAPQLLERIAKKWGADVFAKKLGAEVTEKAIDEYLRGLIEEKLKDGVKDKVKEVVEHVTKVEEGKDVTNGQLADKITSSLESPTGPVASEISDQVMAEFKP